jgi:hypothetical protein
MNFKELTEIQSVLHMDLSQSSSVNSCSFRFGTYSKSLSHHFPNTFRPRISSFPHPASFSPMTKVSPLSSHLSCQDFPFCSSDWSSKLCYNQSGKYAPFNKKNIELKSKNKELMHWKNPVMLVTLIQCTCWSLRLTAKNYQENVTFHMMSFKTEKLPAKLSVLPAKLLSCLRFLLPLFSRTFWAHLSCRMEAVLCLWRWRIKHMTSAATLGQRKCWRESRKS